MPKNKKSKNNNGTTTTKPTGKNENPLMKAQTEFLNSLPKKLRQNFFSNQHTDPATRAEVWSNQAEIGEKLVNEYSWATPDSKCMKILKHFGTKTGKSGGIVEIGCGANAYWARMMSKHGIDVMAFDSSLGDGGQITEAEKAGGSKHNKSKSKKRKRKLDKKTFDDGFVIHRGGPKVLTTNKACQKRVLFLCYPDEDVADVDGADSVEPGSSSMGAACLEHYQGDMIIHVGELYGDTPSMDQAPWGRSSGAEFQQRLAAEYHCILKVKLTNWLHVHDTISVWKRTELCSIVFQGDSEDEDDEDEEVEYRHVPKNEMLPTDVAAPCCKHLLE